MTSDVENPNGSEVLIEAHNIHKRFGDVEVLKGIDLSARKGDIISLIGPSGSGKSTLLRCFNLLDCPDEGTLSLLGEKIEFQKYKNERRPKDNAQVRRMRTSLSMVFQQFHLWSHMTVLQNIMEAPIHVLKQSRADAKEEALSQLERVGMLDFQNRFPNELSGGQKQRIAIARALAMKPQAILFDEPTSALDPELVRGVLAVMEKLADQGITMLLVTHELAFAQHVSDYVHFIYQGKIHASADPKTFFQHPPTEVVERFLKQSWDTF